MENKYLAIDGPMKISIYNRQLEILDIDFVRLKFLYCGICGSDISLFKGHKNTDYPLTLGHEFVGEVIEIGRNVYDYKVGDYVTSDLNYRCKECKYCKNKKSHLCKNNSIGLFTNRGFANYADIHQNYLFKTNEIKPIYRSTLVEPLACVLHAVDKTKPTENDKILINGTGSIGTLFVFALKQLFPNLKLYINDTISDKLLNLNNVYNNQLFNTYNSEIKSNSFDIIFEASSSPNGLEKACDLIDLGGKLCIMSHLDGYNVDFLNNKLARKDVTVLFPYLNGEPYNMIKAKNMILNGWSTKMDNFLIEFFSMNQIEYVLREKEKIHSNKPIINIVHD